VRSEDTVLTLFMCSIWAGNYFAIKANLVYTDPFTLAALRGIVGGTLVLAAGRASPLSVSPRQLLRLSLLGLFNVTLFLVFLNLGLEYIPSYLASILVYTQPVMVTVLSPLVGERLSLSKLLGVSFAFVGVVLVFADWSFFAVNPLGLLFELLAALSWAVATLFYKSWDSGLSNLRVTGVQNLLGGLFVVPLLFFVHPVIDPAPGFWVYFTYNAVLATAVAYFIYFRVAGRNPVSEFGSFLFFVPVFTMFIASVVSLNPPSLNVLAGTGLVSAGIVLVNTKARRRAPESFSGNTALSK
jgi:drug/metabolite transporter (DMT)-like permease